MVTVDDIAAALKARLVATAEYAAAVPGGTWFGRGPDDPAGYPYAVMFVVALDAELLSGDLHLQEFEARLGVYCPVGDSGVSVGNVEQLLNTALASSAGNTAMQASTLRNATDKILHCLPARPEGEYDPTLREAKDVWRAGLTVRVLTQSDRGVA